MKKIEKEPAEKEKKERKIFRTISTRGRIFKGRVVRKFPKRITIELERVVKIPKFERFMKKKTRIHARLPESEDANIGDIVLVQECRPLSKMIHFIFIKKIKSLEEEKR